MAEKRLSSDGGEAPPKKKISMSFGLKSGGSSSKIAFNLGGSNTKNDPATNKIKMAAPIKMSLGAVQVKG